jgi:hypothetical protein
MKYTLKYRNYVVNYLIEKQHFNPILSFRYSYLSFQPIKLHSDLILYYSQIILI